MAGVGLVWASCFIGDGNCGIGIGMVQSGCRRDGGIGMGHRAAGGTAG
jgi:hypothetical protein